MHIPYEVTPINFMGCHPSNCSQTGSEIRWDYEDFEPTEELISVEIMRPSLAIEILAETENVTVNPNDGEAWGRLGRAYKTAIRDKYGFRNNPVAVEIYQLSYDAYQRAVTLLPNDADWHYGFADLLCTKALWDGYSGQPIIPSWVACVEQLKQAFDINPEHVEANELLYRLDQYYEWDAVRIKLVDLSGPQPDYLILTPQATARATATIKPTASPTTAAQATTSPPSSTLIITSLPTQAASATIAAPEATSPTVESPTTATAAAVTSTTPSQPAKTPLYVGAIVVSVIIAAGIAMRRKQ